MKTNTTHHRSGFSSEPGTAHLLLSALAFLALLLFSSCGAAKLGYFEATPWIVPATPKSEKQLHVFIENIKDTFMIQCISNAKLHVTGFRESFKASLKRGFGGDFTGVVFTDQLVAEGMALHIHRVEPFSNVDNSQVSESKKNGIFLGVYYSHVSVRIEGTLYDNGKKLAHAEKIAVSRESQSPISGADERKQIFIDGVTRSIESLHEALLVQGRVWKAKK